MIRVTKLYSVVNYGSTFAFGAPRHMSKVLDSVWRKIAITTIIRLLLAYSNLYAAPYLEHSLIGNAPLPPNP